MKNTFKIASAFLFLSASFLLNAQNSVAIVDYMKVEPGNTQSYLDVEKEWKAIHQARVDAGLIDRWVMYEKLFSGADDPYQYITVAIFNDFNKTGDLFPDDLNLEGMTDEQLNELMNNTLDARTLVKTEVYHFVSGTENNGPLKYLIFNRMKVSPENDEAYRKMEDEIFKPLHQAAIGKGYRSGWSLWMKWPNPENDFQYVTVDSFEEYGQWMTGEDLLQEVHPDLSMEEVVKMANEGRKQKGTEIWKVVDIVSAPEQ